MLDTQTRTHPVLRAARTVTEAMREVAHAQPLYMSTEDKAAALVELTAAASLLGELRLRLLAASDDVAETTGARDAAAWLAVTTRTRPEDSRADLTLALALDRDHAPVAVALRESRVSLAQANVIVRALDALPRDLDPHTRASCAGTLIGYADDFGPRDLARLGARILQVIAPDIAEQAEARRLAALEDSARERTRLTLRRCGDGTTRLSGLIPDATATRLATYLEAFASPRKATHPGTLASTPQTSTPDAANPLGRPRDPVARLAYPRRLGAAFCHLLESLDPNRLPHHGGSPTTVIVTIGLDQLRRDLAAGDLLGTEPPGPDPTGGRLSAGEIRRLACTAHLVPAVLGGPSEILDLGRAQRLFTPTQRRALLLRDRTCRADGCDIPGTWCEAHHWHPWHQGGPTNLTNAALLCTHHHHRAHDPTYVSERHPDGTIRFHRRR